MKKTEYIQYLCERKLKESGLQDNKEYLDRFDKELINIDVQNQQDYVLTALQKNVKIPQHSSLIYYLLGISESDPIKLGLKLKVKKQSSFPDIDSDFSIEDRDKVVQYFINKYGSDHVAPIGSYGQMKMKMVTRDIARILDINLSETNDVVKNLGDDVDTMTPEDFESTITLEPGEDGFRQDLFDLRQYFAKYPEVRKIIFILKGQLRHLTKHPAGVVATPGKIDESIPLMRHKNELITSWVDGIIRKDLQSSGFIKFDILGLKTLTIIKQILELIRNRQHYNKEADFDLESINRNQLTSLLYEEFSTKLPLDGNDIIYERFRQTDTNGIFQFECIAGMTWIGNYRIEELYKKFENDPMSVHKIGCSTIGKERKRIRKKSRRWFLGMKWDILGNKFYNRPLQKRKIRQRIKAMKKQRRMVWLLALKSGQCILATPLHQFYFRDRRRGWVHGWRKLENLKVGDKIIIDNERGRSQHYCKQKNIVVEQPRDCPQCKKCDVPIKERTCKLRILNEIRDRIYKRRFRLFEIDVIIKDWAEMDVYDIGFDELEYHNYIANGFLVHNSNLMKSLLKEIKPTTFSDITSATALGRPGPLDMGMHHEYAARKHGKDFDFGSPAIEKCLKESFGILVYQEDVMRLCHMVAGFPLDLTDTVRKNLMKSIRDTDAKDKSAKERQKIKKMFIEGFVENGLTEKVAELWWQNCLSFARYGFNKCLSGDTILTRCNGNQHTERNVTIKDLYFMMRYHTKIGRKYRRSGYPKIHAMIDGRIKIDKIKDIIFNGQKPVFRIMTENGFSIKATDIHRFLSENGWLMVKEFKINDLIAVTFQEYDGYKRKGYSDRVKGLSYENDEPGFGKKENNPAYIDGGSLLKHENIEKLKQKYKVCQDCNQPHKRLEVHHKERLVKFDYDRIKYHNDSNMLVLCPGCHKKRHYEMGRTKRYEKGFEITYDKIISIDYVGIEDTYDVEMYGDEHNFVANGFISHNSHAVAYTILSYHMMWFKVYYPLEFYNVLFSNSLTDKFSFYFAEAMSKSINIVPADINKAGDGFTVQGADQIMFGLGHIMGMGPAVVNNVLASRPYESFIQFWDRTSKIKKIGKSAMLAMINAHVFDCFGSQNDIYKQYFIECRKEKKWEMDVDFNDRKFEHEKFVEAYTIDWRTKLSDKQKEILKSLEAKNLSKLVQPKANMKRYVWGVIADIVEKTSKNGNTYYYVFLTDSKFNNVKIRIPLYNKRCKKAFILDHDTGKYRKVDVTEILQKNNILTGHAETSEYMSKVFIDLYEIVCIGNIYEKSIEQTEKLAKYDRMYQEDDK